MEPYVFPIYTDLLVALAICALATEEELPPGGSTTQWLALYKDENSDTWLLILFDTSYQDKNWYQQGIDQASQVLDTAGCFGGAYSWAPQSY